MKSEWNEEQIKELLSQLPAVKDHRSPFLKRNKTITSL